MAPKRFPQVFCKPYIRQHAPPALLRGLYGYLPPAAYLLFSRLRVDPGHCPGRQIKTNPCCAKLGSLLHYEFRAVTLEERLQQDYLYRALTLAVFRAFDSYYGGAFAERFNPAGEGKTLAVEEAYRVSG